RDQSRLARERERAFVARRIGFTDGCERVILVGDEQQISPGSVRICRNFRNPLQDRALEIQLEHHAESARKSRVHGDREIEAEHMAGFEQVFEWWQRLGLVRFWRLYVGGTGWTKGPVHGGVLVEERQ